MGKWGPECRGAPRPPATGPEGQGPADQEMARERSPPPRWARHPSPCQPHPALHREDKHAVPLLTWAWWRPELYSMEERIPLNALYPAGRMPSRMAGVLLRVWRRRKRPLRWRAGRCGPTLEAGLAAPSRAGQTCTLEPSSSTLGTRPGIRPGAHRGTKQACLELRVALLTAAATKTAQRPRRRGRCARADHPERHRPKRRERTPC